MDLTPKSRDMDLIGFHFARAPGKKKRFPSEFHLQFFWSHLPRGLPEMLTTIYEDAHSSKTQIDLLQ